MAELLTDDIIIEKLEADGFMEEPDGPWILEHIESEYGGNLDTTSDFVDDRWTLKIYSESTYDGYEVYFCTNEDRPYISQDGYYYENYTEWSERALNELTSGANVWVENHIWDDMEWDFNHMLGEYWQEIYQELWDEMKDQLLESGDYYEEEQD